MIKLIKYSNTINYCDRQIKECTSLEQLIKFYDSFSNNYESLDAKFRFSEAFEREYVYDQLSTQFARRSSPLYCLPIGVKDIFNTKILPTAMGSEIWKGFKAGNNARIIDEIHDRGGITFSKTTTAEFAVHFITAQKTTNPYNLKHLTGTSSTGSAVAVASGALPIALGTQTAGSIIRPASFCGVYGFKPSFGALDRTGVLKTNDTLDTIGFLSADIEGIEKFFQQVLQKGKDYPFSIKYFEHYRQFKQTGKNSLKIGFVTNQFEGYEQYDKNIIADFDLTIKILQREFQVNQILGVEFINEIHGLHEKIYNKSLSYYFKNEIQNYDAVSAVMTDMIRRGEKVSVQEYVDAIKVQPDFKKRFDKRFEEFDFLVTPSTASPAPLLGKTEQKDSCLVWTYLGYPVISIPLYFDDSLNLPYGLQIVGKKYSDFALLEFGKLVRSIFD